MSLILDGGTVDNLKKAAAALQTACSHLNNINVADLRDDDTETTGLVLTAVGLAEGVHARVSVLKRHVIGPKPLGEFSESAILQGGRVYTASGTYDVVKPGSGQEA